MEAMNRPIQPYMVGGVGNIFFDRFLKVTDAPPGLEKNDTVISFDKNAVENAWTAAGGKTPSEWSVGGSCFNVLKAIDRLGKQTCKIISRIGHDRNKELAEYLNTKTTIKFDITSRKSHAGFVNCFITPDKDRSMQAFIGDCLDLSDLENETTKNSFRQFKHLHLEGYLGYTDNLLEKCIDLIKECSPKATISLDLSSIKIAEKMKGLAQRVDYLFGNFQEMQALTNKDNVEDISSEINAPQTTIVITDGAKGCWVRPKNRFDPINFKATCIAPDLIQDTTGAGDFFQAGFLHAALKQKNLETCVAMGNLTSSTVIQHISTDLPDKVWINMKQAAEEIIKNMTPENPFNSSIVTNPRDQLLLATHNYLNFIDKVSSGQKIASEELSHLFAKDFKKIFDNTEKAASGDEFLAELQKIYKERGPWKVTPQQVVVDQDKLTTTFQLYIEMEDDLKLTTQVSLFFNQEGQITLLNEVLLKAAMGELSF